VHRENGNVDFSREAAVVGQIAYGRRIGREPLDASIEGVVVVRSGISHALVAQQITAAEAVVHDVTEGKGRKAQV
jgi:hypothetical protein